jgi:hypothetical protein
MYTSDAALSGANLFLFLLWMKSYDDQLRSQLDAEDTYVQHTRPPTKTHACITRGHVLLKHTSSHITMFYDTYASNECNVLHNHVLHIIVYTIMSCISAAVL